MLEYNNTKIEKYKKKSIDFPGTLQTGLQKQDEDATVTGTEDNLDIYYKGYEFIIIGGGITSLGKVVPGAEEPVKKVTDNNPGDITKDADGVTVGGTESSPYHICCIEDLVAFADIVNAGEITNTNTYIKLDESLDFESSNSYIDSTRTSLTTYSLNGDVLQNHSYETNILTSLTTESGWSKIGDPMSSPFLGTYDGNEKELRNLHIDYVEDTSSMGITGLFGLNNGVIQNLKVTGNVTGTMKAIASEDKVIYVAAIAGGNLGTIRNCTSKAKVTGIQASEDGSNVSVGGIAAINMGTIDNCSNTGPVISKCNPQTYRVSLANIGGVVAECDSGTVNECVNKGAISANNIYTANIGGILGSNVGANVSKCYNIENINANNVVNYCYIGGIIGEDKSTNCNITDCYNIGSIFTTDANGALKGGIIAYEKEMKGVKDNFDGSGIGAIGGVNLSGTGENATLTESQIIDYISNNTHPASESRTYAIDSRLKEGVYVRYATSELENVQLSTDLTGTSSVQYVYPASYDNGWRVLSNDGNTVEIVSDENIVIGTSISDSNLSMTGESAYKNGVKILNIVAGAFLNNELGESTRCIGATTSSIDTITASLTYKPTNYAGLSDVEYYKDYAKLVYIDSSIADSSNSAFWFASRMSMCYDNLSFYGVTNSRYVSNLYKIYEDGTSENSEMGNKNGFRPVIKLKDNLTIKSGDGTEMSPYIFTEDSTVTEITH